MEEEPVKIKRGRKPRGTKLPPGEYSRLQVDISEEERALLDHIRVRDHHRSDISTIIDTLRKRERYLDFIEKLPQKDTLIYVVEKGAVVMQFPIEVLLAL